jgi:2-polyprenyl-3-methyl-5-hydroxy-6-metoxy-1,4-benzoquinol methylase
VATDAPYPELKKSHTMARTGRPWRDVKPPPSGPVWGIIQGYGSYWMLVAAIELGLFDAVHRHGSSAVSALADELDAQPVPLQHLCDAMVAFGLLDQVGDQYELTETAERYLCTDGPASMVDLVAVAPGPLANWQHLAATIRSGVVAEPIDDNPAAFYAPLVRATFPTQFRAASRLGMRLGWARRPGLRVLDLGAGCGPWSAAILDASAGSTATVNDLPGVVDLAVEMMTARGVADRVHFRPGDFHDVTIEQSAYDVAVLGHVCRTEGEARARSLISRCFDGLVPGGQLLIADYFADNDRKFNPFGVQMGMTMLASTRHGGMLTNEQVVGWLADAGFVSIRLTEPIGFNFVYVADRTA